MKRIFILLALVCQLTACGGGSDNNSHDENTSNTTPTTAPGSSETTLPIANAGRDQNVITGTNVQLSARDSQTSNSNTLTYQWAMQTKPNGSQTQLSSSTQVNTTFLADIDGEYIIHLTVNDGSQDSLTDSINIISTTGNSVPMANAGTDLSVMVNALVELDGSLSTDANNDVLTYEWKIKSAPDNSQALLSSINSPKTNFTPDLEGRYIFTLTVSDPESSSVPDEVVITVTSQNNPPIANAGDTLSVNVNESISLDGSLSHDPDASSLSYSWNIISQPDNSNPSLDDASQVAPNFITDVAGEYVVSLTVNDGDLDSQVDNIIISVIDTSVIVNGHISGTFKHSMGLAIANVNFLINDQSVTTNEQGILSYTVSVEHNATITIETNDDRIPAASYTTNPINQNDNFTLSLGEQILPLYQQVDLLLIDNCDLTSTQEHMLNFTLTKHDAPLFNIDYQFNQTLTIWEKSTVTIPVGVTFNVHSETGLLKEPGQSTYQENLTYISRYVDPSLTPTSTFFMCSTTP